LNVSDRAIVVECIKVATLHAGTTQIAGQGVIDGDIAALGPSPFAPQLLSGAEGIAVTSTAIADSMEAPRLPLGICRVHQTFAIRPAKERLGLLSRDLAAVTPVQSRLGQIIHEDTGLNGALAVLAQPPAVTRFNNDEPRGVHHLLNLGQEQYRIVGDGVDHFQTRHPAFHTCAVLVNKLFQEAEVDDLALICRDLVPPAVLGNVVQHLPEGPRDIDILAIPMFPVYGVTSIGTVDQISDGDPRKPEPVCHLVGVQRVILEHKY
jgi:hypothetical protein